MYQKRNIIKINNYLIYGTPPVKGNKFAVFILQEINKMF